MMKTAGYYRSRIGFIRQLIAKTSPEEEVLLRNGVMPESYISQIPESTDEKPLSFTETCTFNTWFEMHPSKVMGKEKITTSREFPITIIGKPEDVQKGFYNDVLTNKAVTFLPVGWRITFVQNEPFSIVYENNQRRVEIKDYEENTFTLLYYENGKHLESYRYNSIDRCNHHLVKDYFYKVVPQIVKQIKPHNVRVLELEALALEIELQLLEISNEGDSI